MKTSFRGIASQPSFPKTTRLASTLPNAPRISDSRSLLRMLTLFWLFHVCMGQNETGNPSCDVNPGVTTPGGSFYFSEWWYRGRCIRDAQTYGQCQANLRYVLNNLDSLHQAEYSAAATTLALLPTIGALFGTPTSEIWALLRLLPLGGVIVMMLSFGGSLMPTALAEYERASGKSGASAEATSTVGPKLQDDEHRMQNHFNQLERKIRDKVRRRNKMNLPLKTMVAGLWLMMVLLASVLAGIGIVGIGSVYVTLCTAQWWFYLWYVIVTGLVILDSWAQLPFDHYAKLYMSDLRVGYKVEGGAPVTENLNGNLKQLNTLEPGFFTIQGSHESTSARNTLLLIVSIARDVNTQNGRITSISRYILQLFLKLANVTIYVLATSIFAAVVLLALPMAQMILMLVLGSGILARATAANMVSSMTQQESLLHIIVESEEEADQIITKAFQHQVDIESDTKFQIEIDGNLFVEQRRIKTRSKWRRRFLGVLASPYDFTRHSSTTHDQSGVQDGLLRKGTEGSETL